MEVRKYVEASHNLIGRSPSGSSAPSDGPRLGSWAAVLLLVLSLMFVTAGCLTGDISVKIDRSGSGSIDLELLPADELQKLLVDADAITAIQGAVEDYDGATFETTTVDGRIAYRSHIPFDDYRDLADVLAQGFQVMGSDVHLFSEFNLSETDDNWRLDATLAQEMLSDELRSDPSLQQLIDSSGITSLRSDLRLTISLPGRVTRTNGERMASGTVSWSLKKDSSPTLMMVTEPKPLLTMAQKVIVGAGSAMVLGIVFILWGSRVSWRGSSERKERKRAKRITFGPKLRVGKGDGWDNSGPLAPAPEGTVPDSGPMPPRTIPTLHKSTAATPDKIVAPPTSNLPPVAPPVAPAVDPSVADPFAPHLPGAPLAGEAGRESGRPASFSARIAPPVAPAVDPNRPDPFAPHVPGAPIVEPALFDASPDRLDLDVADLAPTASVPPVPITPIPTEPAPSEHPGFVFDGQPGWFSLEPEDVSDGGVGDGTPAPAFSPDEESLTDAPPESAVDPASEPDNAEADGAAAEAGVNQESVREAGSIPAAWYPDPDDPNRYRWWDGGDWTDYVSGEGS